jgi:hypothetical protein
MNDERRYGIVNGTALAAFDRHLRKDTCNEGSPCVVASLRIPRSCPVKE